MNDLKATTRFDPGWFGLRSWFDGRGRLFCEGVVLAMPLPKGGGVHAKWFVWHGPGAPESGAPFLVADETGRFP